MMALEDRLVEWDGKSIDYLMAIYHSTDRSDDWVDSLLSLLPIPCFQSSASWLLKHHLQCDQSLSPRQISAAYDGLEHLEHRQAQLHLLQCIPQWKVSADESERVNQFVERCLDASNTFVRVWAYGALDHLARQHSEYRKIADKKLNRALENESASVKARIRQVMRTKDHPFE